MQIAPQDLAKCCECVLYVCVHVYVYVYAEHMSIRQLTDKYTQDLAKELDLGDEDWGEDF